MSVVLVSLECAEGGTYMLHDIPDEHLPFLLQLVTLVNQASTWSAQPTMRIAAPEDAADWELAAAAPQPERPVRRLFG